MKILFVSHHVKGDDGWSRYAQDLVASLQKDDAEVLCLVHELAPGIGIPQRQCLENPLRYVANPFRSLLASFAINKEIRKFSPDVIHFIVEPYATTVPFLHARGARIVLTDHSTFAFLPLLVSGFRRFISNYMTRLVYARLDSVICVSEYTKQHLISHMAKLGALSLVEHKIATIPGGIDLSRVVPRYERAPSTVSQILFVGAIKPRKGLKEALDALALVKAEYVYKIVGAYRENDPYVALLKEKIREYGLEKKVVFEGQVSDARLQELYGAADLFLMLSTNNGADFEGYGLVYVEANARGIPCIGPNDSGVSDAIVDGKTGYLVDQYDAPAVARVVERTLLDHPINSVGCVAWARENSVERKAHEIRSLYGRLVSPRV